MASLQHQQHQQQQQQHYAPLVGGDSPAVPAFDPETSPIPGQQGWAILDLHGRMVRRSNNASAAASASASSLPSIVLDAPTLYNMLVESTPLVVDTSTTTNGGGLNRMTVNFGAAGSSSSLRYVVARDEHHVYLVQTKGV